MPVVARKQLPLRPAGPDTVAALLAWYDQEHRELPWRAPPRKRADAYRVWLSEIMLQQTTVKAVIPYFAAFTARWPTIEALAAASLDDVLAAWAGLGYYSRARNLHACAQLVCERHGGMFPRTEAELRELPGIGPYTAAAIAAIAFGAKATPVDGNIERVVARLFAVETPLPSAKPEVRRLAATLTPPRRAGDFAQAMMDLGATICTPRSPTCLMCPVHSDCKGYATRIAESLPRRAQRRARPVRHGAAYFALREDGCVLLRRRPPKGLLGGMTEVPSTPWRTITDGDRSTQAGARSGPLATAPVIADWWRVPGVVAHTFTHFHLELEVYRALVPREAELTLWADGDRCTWVPRSRLDRAALPSVMRKVIAHALGEA